MAAALELRNLVFAFGDDRAARDSRGVVFAMPNGSCDGASQNAKAITIGSSAMAQRQSQCDMRELSCGTASITVGIMPTIPESLAAIIDGC
jgi:hypothetical protein